MDELFELISAFKKLHEQRVSLCEYYDSGFVEFLKNCLLDLSGAFMRYELLIRSVTFEMTQISLDIKAIQAKASASNHQEFSTIIDAIQDLERQKFHLTAGFQMQMKSNLIPAGASPIYSSEEIDTLLKNDDFIQFQSQKSTLYDAINEQLEEIQCLLDEI